jgi:hypothetical protein
VVDHDVIKASHIEYKALRDEILKRIEMRQNILSMSFTLVIAFSTVAISIGIFRPDNRDFLGLAAFVYPPIATFLALSWAQNDHRISDIGYYIREQIEKKNSYMFNWYKIDEDKLRKFLKNNFKIDWISNANISRIDDEIKILDRSEKNNSISLKLNDKKTEVIMEINDVRTYRFIAEKEYDTLNIYKYSGFGWEIYLHKYQERPTGSNMLIRLAHGGVFVVAQAVAIFLGYNMLNHEYGGTCYYFWSLLIVDVFLLFITIMNLLKCSVDLSIVPPEEPPLYINEVIHLG